MTARSVSLAQQENLTDLRVQSLRLMAGFVGTIGLVWFLIVNWPASGGDSPALAAWLGGPLLILAAAQALIIPQRLSSLVSALFVACVSLAAGCGLLLLPSLQGAYLLILPIIFGSVLLGERAVFILAPLASVFSAVAGLHVFGLTPGSAALWLPIITTLMVAIASWLSARNLYTALDWVWSGYEQAHANEQLARQQQGELRQALKALDEASYRLERANYMLTVARDQAEEARRLKQQFAQTISHELRTPLNLIVGFTELLAGNPEYYGGKLPAAYVRDLSIVHRNACHLQSLVNDVLDLARIEAAQMALQPEETDPGLLLQEAANTVRGQVEVHGLALHTVIEPGLPRIWLDPNRIRQVLINLLSNALRFTEQGSITAGVERQRDELVFSVADTGAGIAPEYIAVIFEEFRQVDGTTRRRHGGTGLGLAISRRFVELHGGHIWVKSQVGQGSTFFFSLPLQQLHPIVSPTGPAPVSHSATTTPCEVPVLVAVTRSPAAASLLSRYTHGLHTVIVPDLEQGRRTASQLAPQAILIDQSSAPMSLGELQRLGKEWSLSQTPFIACPLPGEESLRQQLAVDAYLIKPISKASLWDTLRRFGENIDRVLIIDDDVDFAKLVSRMLTGNAVRRYQVVSASTGREGIALVQHRRPDLILLDMVLPDMNGAQVLASIRALPEGRQVPVVIVSAQDELSSSNASPGATIISRASGLSPVEIVRLVETVVEMAIKTDGKRPGHPEGLAPRPVSPEMPPHLGTGPGLSA